MKKLLLAAALLLASASANAAWYAEAHSGSAMGYGQSFSRANAITLAMNNCIVRTPYWDVCVITIVYRVN